MVLDINEPFTAEPILSIAPETPIVPVEVVDPSNTSPILLIVDTV